ncbi:hypothetical protein [Vulcanisaeta sp. JCM 16161]|nr:hypothetical protein [Vulcanisaeta sp. JCM 16161]
MSNDIDAIISQLTDLEKKILAHIYHYGPTHRGCSLGASWCRWLETGSA